MNIDASDFMDEQQHLVLGILWQIIRIGLFSQITLENCPGLLNLLIGDEKIEDMMKLSPEEILLRWVNYHLDRAGTDRKISNFNQDIKDSEIYTYLLNEIAPQEAGVDLSPLNERKPLVRAEEMLQQADKLKCRSFITPRDVVEGVNKLNVAFVANLFNTHPALEEIDSDLADELHKIEETREEKTYRNWMNSLGVNPTVNWLYNDLASGLILFQIYDVIKPGVVNWKRVVKRFKKLSEFLQKVENCNYAVELGKKLRFSLVGIAGQDISEGQKMLTLALVWQMMRAYTLSILTALTGDAEPITEPEIIKWANEKLKEGNKTREIHSFQDPSISNCFVILDLIDSIKPGCISMKNVNFEATSREEKLANAKYAISSARKLGARVYALPEDIVEVKPKMVMTVFACLMSLCYNRPSVELEETTTTKEKYDVMDDGRSSSGASSSLLPPHHQLHGNHENDSDSTEPTFDEARIIDSNGKDSMMSSGSDDTAISS